MARTNAVDVLAIMDVNDSNASLYMQAFINAANSIVTANLGSSGLGVSTLMEIEKWLTAHLYTISKGGQVQREKIGETEMSYGIKTGVGLDSTLYGQTVKMLDTTGILSNLGKQPARFDVLCD